MIQIRRVTFRGAAYILVGMEDGALATERQFRTGATAFAYVTPAGEIYSDGEVIGTRDDLRLGEVEHWPAYRYPPSLN